MSELLLVFPEGWVPLNWEFISSKIPDMNRTNVDNWIATGQFSYIEEFLKQLNLIQADATVVSAKLIDDKFAILLG